MCGGVPEKAALKSAGRRGQAACPGVCIPLRSARCWFGHRSPGVPGLCGRGAGMLEDLLHTICGRLGPLVLPHPCDPPPAHAMAMGGQGQQTRDRQGYAWAICRMHGGCQSANVSEGLAGTTASRSSPGHSALGMSARRGARRATVGGAGKQMRSMLAMGCAHAKCSLWPGGWCTCS